MADLTRSDVWPALSSEIDGAAALLRQSLGLLRALDFVANDGETILVCLAAGTEKLTKLTYGLTVSDSSGDWPSKHVMRSEFKHNVVKLDLACRDLVSKRMHLSTAPGLLAPLLNGVAVDPLIAEVLATVADYGGGGRFHNLDTLADGARTLPSPLQRWTDIERSVLQAQPDLLEALVNGDRLGLNEVIRTSVRGWWQFYWRAWLTGVCGPRAKQWSAQLKPTD